MGGYGALKIAMKYPQVFGQVAGMSPAHFPDPTVGFCANIMLMEDQMWRFSGPSLPFDPAVAYKFVNNTIYGISAAWLCNPNNPPLYLDLPFSYSPEGAPIFDEELMVTWRSKNLLGLIPLYVDNLSASEHIYFDCGKYDELGMTMPNMTMHDVLVELGIGHEFELYEGYHISNVYDRLGKNLINLSKGFPQDFNHGNNQLTQ
jgi:S-formylglutathione hydrolase FrmB